MIDLLKHLDPSAISVVASGCVAVAAILAPLLVAFFSDWVKWARERKATQADKIDQAADRLLGAITPFMTGSITNAEAATQHNWAQVYVDLQSKYYTWERSLWPHCKGAERVRLEELRNEFETLKPADFLGSAARMANTILALTHSVSERVI